MFNLKSAIIPSPQYIRDKNKSVSLGVPAAPEFIFKVNGSGELLDSARDYLAQKLTDKLFAVDFEGDYTVTLSVNPRDVRFKDIGRADAYIIDIGDESASLVGFDEGGAYYAAISFVKLMHEEDGEVLVPACEIIDYPKFKTRGHFMESRYGSDFMTLEDWEKGLDYLSEMKINTIIPSVYGCWTRQYDGDFAEYLYAPISKYPKLNTPRNIKYYSVKERKWVYKKQVLPTMFEDDYLGEMIACGKKKNINVFPLFNSWGHNTLIPRVFPEISAKNEDGSPRSVGFCTNDERTFEVMFDIYDEIIDRHLLPNGIDSFEIGMDEIRDVMGVDKNNLYEVRSPFCKCPRCADKPVDEIMINFIIRLVKHLKEKGMKNVYIYHDMLFHHNLLTEETAELFKKEGIYDTVVIDWWSYTTSKDMLFEGKADQIKNTFRSIAKPITGYYHWSLHCEANQNIYIISEFASDRNFEGVVGYSSFDYCYDYNYHVLAQCAWNPDAADPESDLNGYCEMRFGNDASSAAKAIKLSESFIGDGGSNHCKEIFDYYINGYLSKDKPYPQHYPSNSFSRIADGEEEFMDYLTKVRDNSAKVLETFENINSGIGKIWTHNVLAYNVLANEFLTLYNTAVLYNEGKCSNKEFARITDELICRREGLMLLTEEIKIPANQKIMLRNQTIMWSFLRDLALYLKKNPDAKLDLCDFWDNMSKASKFMR